MQRLAHKGPFLAALPRRLGVSVLMMVCLGYPMLVRGMDTEEGGSQATQIVVVQPSVAGLPPMPAQTPLPSPTPILAQTPLPTETPISAQPPAGSAEVQEATAAVASPSEPQALEEMPDEPKPDELQADELEPLAGQAAVSEVSSDADMGFDPFVQGDSSSESAAVADSAVADSVTDSATASSSSASGIARSMAAGSNATPQHSGSQSDSHSDSHSDTDSDIDSDADSHADAQAADLGAADSGAADADTAAGRTRQLSVQPGRDPLLPEDHPRWILDEDKLDGDVHRLVVYTIATARRSKLEPALDTALMRRMEDYVNQSGLVEGYGNVALSPKVNADYIKKILIDEPEGYVAEIATSDGIMYQKWVKLAINKAHRDQIRGWQLEEVQASRAPLVGLGLAGLLGLVGLTHLVLRRWHGAVQLPGSGEEMDVADEGPKHRSMGVVGILATLFFVGLIPLLLATLFVGRSVSRQVVVERVQSENAMENTRQIPQQVQDVLNRLENGMEVQIEMPFQPNGARLENSREIQQQIQDALRGLESGAEIPLMTPPQVDIPDLSGLVPVPPTLPSSDKETRINTQGNQTIIIRKSSQ